jgi:enoyl-CoA hydratase/carnithine racemase
VGPNLVLVDYNFRLIDLRLSGGVGWATIDNPPINLMTALLYQELAELAERFEADETAQVLVLQSANPEFFIAHFDVEEILRIPTAGEVVRESGLNPFHQMCERYRSMPKATICKLAGRVGGGGSELAASCDMRFGVAGKTVVNQMEVPLGILPGGTGTQRLPRLLGRGRALELILGGDDLDASTAERWGYLNRVFSDVGDLDAFVDGLAARIARFPAPAVKMAKEAVLRAEPDWRDGLIEESYLFQCLLRTPEAPAAMRRFLELGGQTPQGEGRVGQLNGEISDG